MGGKSATSTSPPEDAPSSRSLFSRFSFLSRSRTRNIADFHIRPAEPHRKYSAGDHVAGAVVLTVLKPVRITHLTATLHGFVKVHKGPGAGHDLPVNPTQVSSGGGTGRVRYFGNGHASLFQDEQVLSADGRLEAGRYEFNFDLVFPTKGLPSSIDFERGTISYMITATLTRPTSISPVTSCDRKIYLVEQIDIGSFSPPRPRTISLEPISRRPKRRRHAATERRSTASDAADASAPSELESSRAAESTTDGSVADDAGQEPPQHQNPRSPSRTEFPDVVSEYSAESAVSGSTGGAGGTNRISDAALSSSSASQAGSRTPTAEEQTITANVEMLKAGGLPGDMIPVKITVHHIKRIKSVHGVIATLYRQGRIDSAPPISLFKDLSKEDMRRLEKEEYFPRSKTGLSGLSLSSAGSCSVFRKDLCQAFGPLIINPVTLDASITISVRIPEDVFPTIKGVPGELIGFRYQLEVIVDLGGKLASHLQSGQSKSGGMPTPTGPAALIRNPYEHGSGILGNWGGSIIDTDQLRRQKGVISVVFDVPVGTMDSSRQRAKGALRPYPSDESTVQYQHQHQQPHQPQHPPDQNPPPHRPPAAATVHFQDEKRGHRTEFVDEGYGNAEDDSQYAPFIHEYPPRPGYPTHDPPAELAPVYIPPPPNVPDESGLSEKDRIRRAEQRLLPSQPPPEAGPSSSAPQLEDDDLYSADGQQSSSPSAPQPAEPCAPIESGHEEAGASAASAPSAPTIEELDSYGAATHGAAVEDKLERERRRLLAEASAPPEFPEDCAVGAGSAAAAGPSSPAPASGSAATAPPEQGFEPSAPVFSEADVDDDAYGQPYAFGGRGPSSPASREVTGPSEPLPRYER